MKITIEEVEIKQAIVAHVLSQMNVREGMEVTVELRATRGETGMQANINIVPEGTETARPTPAPVTQLRRTPAPTLVTPAVVSKPAPIAAAPAPAEDPAPAEPEAEAELDETSTAELEVEVDQGALAEAETAAQAEEQPAAPVEGAKKPSIFGGLRGPKNKPSGD